MMVHDPEPTTAYLDNTVLSTQASAVGASGSGDQPLLTSRTDVRRTRNVFHDLSCHGCKHLQYSAPDGQPTYPGADALLAQPHARCGHFAAYIPAVKEKGRVVFYVTPTDCPTRVPIAQKGFVSRGWGAV